MQISHCFSSYNFGGGVQLQNTDYNICVRRESGYCGIEFSAATPESSPDSFQTDSTIANVGTAVSWVAD